MNDEEIDKENIAAGNVEQQVYLIVSWHTRTMILLDWSFS